MNPRTRTRNRKPSNPSGGRLHALRDDQKRSQGADRQRRSRLKILDAYGKMLDRKNVEIEDGIETYRTERDKVFQDHMAGLVRDRDSQRRSPKPSRRRDASSGRSRSRRTGSPRRRPRFRESRTRRRKGGSPQGRAAEGEGADPEGEGVLLAKVLLLRADHARCRQLYANVFAPRLHRQRYRAQARPGEGGESSPSPR